MHTTPPITKINGFFNTRPAIESRMEVMIAGQPKQIMARVCVMDYLFLMIISCRQWNIFKGLYVHIFTQNKINDLCMVLLNRIKSVNEEGGIWFPFTEVTALLPDALPGGGIGMIQFIETN